MNKVVVRILGSEYNIVGKNPEQMKSVARYVDEEMNKIREGNPKLSSLTTTIVACLNIADELFDCAHENEDLHNEIAKLKENMSIPSEESIEQEGQIAKKLEQKELETIEKDYRIEELERYKVEIESLKNEAQDANKRAESAETMSSQWQNKTYSLQLKCSELESKLKNREGAL